jgi:hypothetical protein
MPTATSLETIQQIFNHNYAAWDITFPSESLNNRLSGSIVKNGWTINFQFGTEEGIDYLEYFASHRMTNDTLNRIFADGRKEILGYCQEFYEADNERAEREYLEHNRKFYEEVKRRGLW